MKRFVPGEVWVADLGIAGKVRPVLVLTPTPTENEMQLVTFLQLTTQVREGNPWELRIAKPWLRDGIFHLQQVTTLPAARFEWRLGALTDDEFNMIKTRLRERLGL